MDSPREYPFKVEPNGHISQTGNPLRCSGHAHCNDSSVVAIRRGEFQIKIPLCAKHIPDPTGCYCKTDECDGSCVASPERWAANSSNEMLLPLCGNQQTGSGIGGHARKPCIRDDGHLGHHSNEDGEGWDAHIVPVIDSEYPTAMSEPKFKDSAVMVRPSSVEMVIGEGVATDIVVAIHLREPWERSDGVRIVTLGLDLPTIKLIGAEAVRVKELMNEADNGE